MRFRFFAALFVTAVNAPSAARAAGQSFGAAGQLAITDDQPLGAVAGTSFLTPTPPGASSTASFEYATLSDNGGSGTSFALAPAVDYFVARSFSLGANAIVGVLNPAHGNSGSGISETLFGIAPRVGYDVPITDTISFWPKLFFGYVTASASASGNGSSVSSGANASAIGVFAPFMFEPARHFLFGIGPNVSTQLSSNTTSGSSSMSQSKITLIGVEATIGGWCLGD